MTYIVILWPGLNIFLTNHTSHTVYSTWQAPIWDMQCYFWRRTRICFRSPSLPYLSSSIYDLPDNISSQIRLFCWWLHNLSWTFLRYVSSTTADRSKLPLPTGLQMANAFNCSKCYSMHITHSTSLVITTYFLNGQALKWLIHTLTLVLLSYQTML